MTGRERNDLLPSIYRFFKVYDSSPLPLEIMENHGKSWKIMENPHPHDSTNSNCRFAQTDAAGCASFRAGPCWAGEYPLHSDRCPDRRETQVSQQSLQWDQRKCMAGLVFNRYLLIFHHHCIMLQSCYMFFWHLINSGDPGTHNS